MAPFALDLTDLPLFCAHEHWGSLMAIGDFPGGFRSDIEQGSLPTRRTGLWAVLLDPYFLGHLYAGGLELHRLAQAEGYPDVYTWAREDFTKAHPALRKLIQPQLLTGTWQCLRRGITALYGLDPQTASLTEAQQLDEAIAARYERPFEWYRKAMEKARFSQLIRPVHPEFYFRKESAVSAAEEATFTRTIMRIDPFLELWQPESQRRDEMAELIGVEPADAASWREFLARWFEVSGQRGNTGIKQLQAYYRSLDFQPRSDVEVVFRGDLDKAQVTAFQDWVVHECLKLASERDWPHQVHVGTHNLTQSNPLPLEALAARYPRVKFVQLHCWPFLSEAGWLAKYHPNVYIDTCWQPILNPAYYEQAMRQWLNYLPTTKLMGSQDATIGEMAAGSALFVRELLAEALLGASEKSAAGKDELFEIAQNILHRNALTIYGYNQ